MREMRNNPAFKRDANAEKRCAAPIAFTLAQYADFA